MKTIEAKTINFDGCGLNGSDEYKSRLATCTEAGRAHGHELEKRYNAFPELAFLKTNSPPTPKAKEGDMSNKTTPLLNIISECSDDIQWQARRIGSLPGLVDWFVNNYRDELSEDDFNTGKVNEALAYFFPLPELTP